MRQGAEQSAPTSFPYTITCMIMLIIINRIQLLYYSSFNFAHYLSEKKAMKNLLKDLKRRDHKRYLGGFDVFRYISPGLLVAVGFI